MLKFEHLWKCTPEVYPEPPLQICKYGYGGYCNVPLGNLGPSLQLGIDTVTASDHVQVLGVTFSCDLSLE